MKRALIFFVFSLSCLSVLPAAALAEGDMASRLSGRILLQVERRGEAWYVSPVDGRRYFLGSPEDAWHALSAHGLGISNDDLARVPLPGGTGDEALARRLAGRILLQVGSRGEAWYVDPVDRRRYRLATPEDTLLVLRQHGLGISEKDIALVPVEGEVPETVVHDVPFIAQAPIGGWSDNRLHEACEEAAVTMAIAWANNDEIDPVAARESFIAMSQWQQRTFGYYQDTSAADTLNRLIREYSGFANADLRTGITAEDLEDVLRDGRIAVVPVDGRAIGNPYFTPPGPLRHMVVVVGYDAGADEFIVHDPGTRRGESMRYGAAGFMDAVGDYASGRYAPVPAKRAKTMIVVHR